MNKKKAILAIIPVLLLACGGSDVEEYKPPKPVNPPTTGEEVIYHKRAKEMFELVNQYYRIGSGTAQGLYRENYPQKTGDLPVSYLWPYDGLVSGAATLHALGYEVSYPALVDRFSAYYRSTSEHVHIGGYGSSTNGTQGGGTRFYDDNSIIGIDLVEAYRLTNNAEYLDKAKQVVLFLKSGEDDLLGGGLWWNEDEKNKSGNENSNKPVCSNGYATLFLLQYYSVCSQAEKADVLAFAKRLYHFVVSNLRDPLDGCYWNDKQISGEIRKAKWTYNTGVMISNAIWLYKITGEQSYLDSAIRSADGAYDYFVRPANGLALAYPTHDPWFTIKLVRAFIDLEPYHKAAGRYIETFVAFIDNGYQKARLTNGFFYEDWTGETVGRAEQLLMQVAVVESLGAIALYKGEKVK